MIPTDFSKHPLSITELRAERTGNADSWTVRDALIKLLREIDDGGEAAQASMIVIAIGARAGNGAAARGIIAGTNNHFEAIGLMHQIAHDLAASE